MIKRGEGIYDLPGLLEALYWESGPGGDRGVNSIIIEYYVKEKPQVRIRFIVEGGSTTPDRLIPFEPQLLIEAFREGLVDTTGVSLPPSVYFYRLSLKGREKRNKNRKGSDS